MPTTGVAELDGYIAAYTPEIAALTHQLFRLLRIRIPGATVMGYNYYTALAIGWSPDEVTSHGVLSLALYPRWVNLCLLRGADLADPHGLLSGTGNQLRTIRMTGPELLEDARIDALIAEALLRSEPPFNSSAVGRVFVKGTSSKVRSRRP
jgi:hypothetical protein